MFPIKYIDNNLVWNKDNEVFAYYELIPYNYSFLSAEQKFIVHDSFRQLIAQSREGKIHALQIATESSIRSMQEQSKKLVTGKLKEVACQKIDEQTEALVSMIGDNQVDYRFFLGFKLMVTEEQLNLKNIKKSVAIDILTFLTGISSRDGEKFPVLRKAVRSVTQSDSRGLLHVIDELRREDTPISRNIADHIDSFTDYDFAHLLFSDGTVENAISLDNQLNIIQVADLVLPDKDTTFEEYTTIELLSVSMLIVISTFALDFIHSDRSIFKIVDLDEAWAFLNVRWLRLFPVRSGK